jgi:hypothetical protein
MTWRYSIEWHAGNANRHRSGAADNNSSGGGARKNIVVVTSKPRSQQESELITVDTWVSATHVGGNGSSQDMAPVAVYTQVRKGGQPVLNARVTVQVAIATEGVDAQGVKELSLEPEVLGDNGFGGEFRSLLHVGRPQRWSLGN